MIPCTYGRDVFWTDSQTGGTRRGREIIGEDGEHFWHSELDACCRVYDPLTAEHFFVRYGDLREVPAPLKSEAP
jgi:hypothetical protein